MKSIITSMIFSILLFTGCTTTKIVYIKSKCPVIQPLEIVPHAKGAIDDNCLCDDSLWEVLKTAKQLRASETYYYEQITKYNKDFNTTNTLTNSTK